MPCSLSATFAVVSHSALLCPFRLNLLQLAFLKYLQPPLSSSPRLGSEATELKTLLNLAGRAAVNCVNLPLLVGH